MSFSLQVSSLLPWYFLHVFLLQAFITRNAHPTQCIACKRSWGGGLVLSICRSPPPRPPAFFLHACFFTSSFFTESTLSSGLPNPAEVFLHMSFLHGLSSLSHPEQPPPGPRPFFTRVFFTSSFFTESTLSSGLPNPAEVFLHMSFLHGLSSLSHPE